MNWVCLGLLWVWFELGFCCLGWLFFGFGFASEWVEMGLLKVGLALGWIGFGLMWVCFGLGWVCLGLVWV